MNEPDVTIDYMQIDLDGVITIKTADLPDGADASDHIIVRDHDAEPAVARVLEIDQDRTTIRVLPGSVEDNADLLEHPAPTSPA